jgi:hypothetical protein
MAGRARSGDENWVDQIGEHSAGGPARLWAAIDARRGVGAPVRVGIYRPPVPVLLNWRTRIRNSLNQSRAATARISRTKSEKSGGLRKTGSKLAET